MSRDVSLLHPRLQGVVRQMQSEFPDMLVTETYRTVAEQDALYAKGRTTSGNIVTYAKGSSYSSQHQWGIAFDVVKQNANGSIDYNDNAFWAKIGARAKQLGCGWGGDWSGFIDKPHIYLPDWGSGTSILKNEYKTFENFKSTWGESPQNISESEEMVMLLMSVEGSPAIFFVNLSNMTMTAFDKPDELYGINMMYKAATGKDLSYVHFTAAAPWHARISDVLYRAPYEGFVGMFK